MKNKHKIGFILAITLATTAILTPSFIGFHDTEDQSLSINIKEEGNSKELNIEKMEAPIYYTVFKLILDFSTIKPAN